MYGAPYTQRVEDIDISPISGLRAPCILIPVITTWMGTWCSTLSRACMIQQTWITRGASGPLSDLGESDEAPNPAVRCFGWACKTCNPPFYQPLVELMRKLEILGLHVVPIRWLREATTCQPSTLSTTRTPATQSWSAYLLVGCLL